jgi:predicted lipoprotein
MESISPAKPAFEPPAQPAQRTPETPAAPATARDQPNAQIAAAQASLAPDKLLVYLDSEAGRFVEILTDAESQETIWRYPSEAQLAYSRAVKAYLRALSEE